MLVFGLVTILFLIYLLISTYVFISGLLLNYVELCVLEESSYVYYVGNYYIWMFYMIFLVSNFIFIYDANIFFKSELIYDNNVFP